MMQISTGLANYILGTGSVAAAFNLGVIKIYGGTPPDGPDDDVTQNGGGTVLGTYNNGGTGITWDAGGVSGGVLSKTGGETWGGNNSATGTATFFRILPATHTDTASTTERRIQGTCG